MQSHHTVFSEVAGQQMLQAAAGNLGVHQPEHKAGLLPAGGLAVSLQGAARSSPQPPQVYFRQEKRAFSAH